MSSIKGPQTQKLNGSGLRIAIVHARWNSTIIDPLVEGAKKEMLACGVKPENIVVQTVPGSWELPSAVQRLYAASQVQSSTTSSGGDLLSSGTLSPQPTGPSSSSSSAPFDAIIAVGVLIKGETMHFEYICDAVSHGLMRVGLDAGIPVIFGVLTVLDEDQAKARAGLLPGSHNHGNDWGLAAVEMGVKRRSWSAGTIE
ncbi:hypothetical protein TD95_000327 [Thielaviopsis punctulata]|uniref:6,7-dimethyl-8-ribityllumazine synthase n=1 Tax=Thielaviopsis punctulata TaxID=72032 RepID=A0A0F4Z7I3_9PEZI|nr:hypothetical protein TD95_000327 [Thielaviopsis punctulata]